jgi:hypothetical protein
VICNRIRYTSGATTQVVALSFQFPSERERETFTDMERDQSKSEHATTKGATPLLRKESTTDNLDSSSDTPGEHIVVHVSN